MMGSWFSNFHIRKNATLTVETVMACVKDRMAQQGYVPAVSEAEADGVVAIVDISGGRWVTVCSDLLLHDDPDSSEVIAKPLSSQLHTDVLGAACFDSDYMYLNLINADEELNGWIGIGPSSEVGIKRRNNVTAWKKKVTDYPTFAAAAKEKYICADEFLLAAEAAIGLSVEQASVSLDCLQGTDLQNNSCYLYFVQEQGENLKGPCFKLGAHHHPQVSFSGIENEATILNMGDASYGLSIYFLGPYVEYEEITFSNVRLTGRNCPDVELQLEKVQLTDGQWAYRASLPDYPIPKGVPRRINKMKRIHLENERLRTLRFVPHGNTRKMMDISIMFVPDVNPERKLIWNAWQRFGSKQACIKEHNRIWKLVRGVGVDPSECLPYLKLEDFDE